MPPSAYRREEAGATAGMPPCVAKQVTRPIRNREAPVAEPHLAWPPWTSRFTRASSPTTIRTPSLAFYRDTLGFEVRNDVEYGGMHWITVGPADQPGTSIVLYPPEATPGVTDDERRTIAEMMAKGTFASINLATADLDGTFERLQAGDADVVQEPTEQPYGVRDCVVPRSRGQPAAHPGAALTHSAAAASWASSAARRTARDASS